MSVSMLNLVLHVHPAGYSFFDSGDVELLGRRRAPSYYNTGKLDLSTLTEEMAERYRVQGKSSHLLSTKSLRHGYG